MSLAPSRDSADKGFALEDISTGLHASGFGQLGDGRSFSFHVEHQQLIVEIYRPRLAGRFRRPRTWWPPRRARPVDIDLFDERSLIAAVRDAVANAQPVPRTAR